jgi:hypothetical protein
MRPLTQQEAAVIAATLERATLVPVAPSVLSTLGQLQVVGQCECGCASIDFLVGEEAQGAQILADGLGTLEPGGTDIGVMVWGFPDRLTALEVYECSEAAPLLPSPSSIHPW